MTLELKFYGGVGEIGGNKILLRSGSTSVFLDFGKSFSLWRRYFERPWNVPKSVEDLKLIGEMPPDSVLSEASAVFISHAHQDHVGRAHLLNCPVFAGEGAKVIISAIVKTALRADVETPSDEFPKRIRAFRSGDRIPIGDCEVMPVHVDHSIPAAYGFIVDTPDGRVVYTGDFRLHGPHSELTADFVRQASRADVDVLIVEGTHADFSGSLSEEDVRGQISRIIESADRLGSKRFFIADFSRTDFDRFMTFYRVAREFGKTLVLDIKRAVVIKEMVENIPLRDKPQLSSSAIAVLLPNKKKITKKMRSVYEEFSDFLITPEELKSDPSRYIITIPFRSPAAIRELSPPRGSIYFLSSSEPVDEESEISFERLLNWLEMFGVAVYHIHSSGHATPLEIARLVESLSPEMIVPVHTERPNFLKNFLGSRYRWCVPTKYGDSCVY